MPAPDSVLVEFSCSQDVALLVLSDEASNRRASVRAEHLHQGRVKEFKDWRIDISASGAQHLSPEQARAHARWQQVILAAAAEIAEHWQAALAADPHADLAQLGEQAGQLAAQRLGDTLQQSV